MGNTAGDAYRESLAVIRTIKEAWETGYTLVPLVGAGISVDSGMPLVDPIISYLVMIRQYVGLKAYRPKYVAARYASIDEDYQDHPIRYIRHYGWPDRFQLRHELMLQYPKTEPGEPGYDARTVKRQTFDDWIAGELDNVVSSLKKWQKEEYEKLIAGYREAAAGYQALAARSGEPGLPSLPVQKVRSTWQMLGDWRAMIREFTEFTLDDADSLFERLYRWHKPGRSHHFFAFLTRLMGLRLFLTTNFDNFLERALTEQGIDHRVFGVEHGDNLPHESLVRETVSVIKLHGDTHQLLVDEKLDYPPSPEYLKRLRACMPKRPILMVMGCGGNDSRILQVVTDHAEAHRKANAQHRGAAGKIPSVIWLHFEHPRNEPRTLANELGDEIMHARVTNPGFFLSHLYACLRSQHPASRVPYQTHLPQPIAPLAPGTSTAASIATYRNARQNVFIYEQRSASAAGERVAASQVMADFVYTRKTEHHCTPIWINLEAHHSVGAVVQQIVEQCRVHDTFVSPFDVPSRAVDPDGTAIALTVERLLHLLRRGRYVLAFDALEAFPWPPTAHHGASGEQESAPETERLFALLEALMTHRQLQSDIGVVICASFDLPRRRGDPGDRSELLARFAALVKHATGDDWTAPPDSERRSARARTALSDHEFVVSCFRRPRSLVSLSSVFFDIFGDESATTSAKLDELTDAGCLVPIEGGFFRMRRGERDEMYNERALETGTDDVKRALAGPAASRMALIAKCYALASTHGLVARCYYSDSYLHSLDPWIFFEYFYHRLSSIRYITKLVVLLEAVAPDALDHTLDVVIPPKSVIKDEHRNRAYTLREILAYVGPERASLLQALKHALDQAHVHLLRGLPASQLEAWCKGVLDDNFSFRIDAEDGILELARCRVMKARYGSELADTGELAEDVSGIFWSLLGLLRKSLFQQGRNREASDVAWVQLAQNAAQVQRASATPHDAPPRHAADRVLGWLCETDAARGLDDRARPGAIGGGDAHEECVQNLLDVLACRPDARDLLRTIHRHYAEHPVLHLLAKQNQLRVLCLLAEGRLTEVARERFDAHLHRPLAPREREERDARLELVEEALAICRVVSPHGARDSSHDPYYLRFRARLLMAKARLQWLGATNHLAFRDSDWYLEGARASVSSDDHARLARLEMAWTEGLLLQANHSLNSDCDGPTAGEQVVAREHALASARVDYLRAGDALQRAREHLTRGSRDVELWACYQRLWAQYQAEWCLFQLAQLECELRDAGNGHRYKHQRALAETAPRETAALLKRLKRGLNGLQAGLVIKPDGNRDPWMRRIWLELLCAGMVYGVTVAASTSRYEALLPAAFRSATWPLGISTFWAHWRLMNERAGIPTTTELDGPYTTYLAQTLDDPGELSATWRTDLIATFDAKSSKVSKLRAHALRLAEVLYEAAPSELTSLLRQGLTPRLLPLSPPPSANGTQVSRLELGEDGEPRGRRDADVPRRPVG